MERFGYSSGDWWFGLGYGYGYGYYGGYCPSWAWCPYWTCSWLPYYCYGYSYYSPYYCQPELLLSLLLLDGRLRLAYDDDDDVVIIYADDDDDVVYVDEPVGEAVASTELDSPVACFAQHRSRALPHAW